MGQKKVRETEPLYPSSPNLSHLKDYWKKSKPKKSGASKLTVSQDNREIKKCFQAYDMNNSGALEYDEAILYIGDMLKISGLDNKILSEAEKRGEAPQEFFKAYIDHIFKEMDPKKTGKLEFNQLVKPKMNEWDDLLRFVSSAVLFQLSAQKKGEQITSIVQDDDPYEVEDLSEEAEHLDKGSSGHTALTQSCIVKIRSNLVSNVCEILSIEKSTALALLNHFKWDHQKLLVAYAEDPEKTCKEAGVVYKKTMKKPKSKKKDIPDQIDCSVCFDTTPDFTILDNCHHSFCNDCWKDNFDMQIREGKTLEIQCMHTGCKELVPEEIVKKLVSPETWNKYTTFLSKKFVEGSKEVRWCPAPGCDKAITDPFVEGTNLVGVCSCGYRCCWRCSKISHSPATCEIYSSWEEKANVEDLAVKIWLYKHTKPCPQCKHAIEKNDGCFCMGCSQCGHSFCWLCLDSWSSHSDHFRCSKYNTTDLNNNPEHHEEEGIYKKDDQVFYHYLERCKEYIHAENIGKQNRTKYFEDIIREDGLFDEKALIHAIDTLNRCRHVIQCIFACLYADFRAQEEAKGTEKEKEKKDKKSDKTQPTPLNSQLEIIEIITEKLAQVLERDFLTKRIYKVDEMRSITKVVDQCLTNLLNEDMDKITN